MTPQRADALIPRLNDVCFDRGIKFRGLRKEAIIRVYERLVAEFSYHRGADARKVATVLYKAYRRWQRNPVGFCDFLPTRGRR
jgi:hypothetical protein